MGNTEGVVLRLLLQHDNSEQALLAFSKLKERYFSPAYRSLYNHMYSFYSENGAVPKFSDLSIYRGRDIKTRNMLNALLLVDCGDIDLDFAVDCLINDYATDTVIDLLHELTNDLTLLDRHELLDSLAALPIKFEEAVASPEKVFTVKDLTVFKTKESTDYVEVSLALSNKWESTTGYRRQELALLGGKRGSGKSLVCTNIAVNQMEQGNVVPYFTIEMTGDETLERTVAIATGVSSNNIRHNNLTVEEQKKVGTWLASQYENSEQYLQEFLENPLDPFKFEATLKANCEVKEDGRLVIVDDRALSLTAIDVQLSKLKARYGDKLKVAIIDYLNQIVWEGHDSDMYDWKPQVIIAKQLKNLARKYDILIVSPYQIDASGEARFARGILDACDTAQILDPDKENGLLTLRTTKARGGDDRIVTTVGMDWDKSLRINPVEVDTNTDPGDAPEETDEKPPFQPDVPKGATDL